MVNVGFGTGRLKRGAMNVGALYLRPPTFISHKARGARPLENYIMNPDKESILLSSGEALTLI